MIHWIHLLLHYLWNSFEVWLVQIIPPVVSVIPLQLIHFVPIWILWFFLLIWIGLGEVQV